ncbi:hypothetical protein M0R04_01070 [Candidatus Dojkabacteria bacterium]|jgi:hypothetical protein|nr:hypothetical protein [Candidatus Dojkabacteria bacterium]
MSKTLIIILSVVCTLLVGTSIYLGYRVLTEKKVADKTTDTTTETTTDTTDTTAPEVVADTPTLPDGWIYRESTLYKYKVGEPSSWYYRFFDSTKYVGLDTAAIPEATEYGGKITFGIVDATFLTSLDELKANLVSPVTTDMTINGNSWTQISGVVVADSAFFAGYKQVTTYITYESKTFVCTLLLPNSSYSTYADIYSKVLESAVLDTSK